tara:strand:- start:44623 stop:45531 length:909 start_codon:yes stop_codon:yes gene_type:complete
MNKIYIIAEIGSNYDNDLSTAFDYIKASKEAGADAVKFQTLKKDKLISPTIYENEKNYKNLTYDNFTNLELSDEWHLKLKEYSNKIEIDFISTPFFLEAVDLLETIKVKKYKIASGDITFFPLLEKVAKTNKPIILSTGASTLEEIKNAKDIIEKNGNKDITFLHCVSNYPPKWEQMNILAINTLKKELNSPVGISDHSPGDIIPISAVALGATVIEKHITFNRKLSGPDHAFAMEINEFKTMINKIRILEKAMGNGEKIPSVPEKERIKKIRRGKYNPETLEPINSKTDKCIWLRPEHDKK